MDGMKQLFRTLIVTLPGLANVTGLLFLLFFVYAVVGVQLFANVAYHGSYNEQANFRTFGSAMLLLLRMATGVVSILSGRLLRFSMTALPHFLVRRTLERCYAHNCS